MKLVTLIEQIYTKKRDVNTKVAMNVTFPNSLQYLSLCADYFQRKQQDTRASIWETQACRRLAVDSLKVIKEYYNFLDNLASKGLAKKNSDKYYTISLSTDFDQIVYMPRADQDFIKYRFENIVSILHSVDKVLNNYNIDTVIVDNEEYLDLVYNVRQLSNKAKSEYETLKKKMEGGR